MKLILLLVSLVFLMSGCANGDSLSFSGTGDNWDITLEAVVTNEVNQQIAWKIKYIGDNEAPETIDYEIVYNKVLGHRAYGEKSPLNYGAIKSKGVTCGNCEIIQKDDEIEAEIMWEGQTEKLILTIDK